MHSTGRDGCVCGPFYFPATWAATRHLRRSYRHFWRVLVCKELIMAEDNPPPPPTPPTPHTHNCAAHNNILAQPRCSCWCQCLVVTQPKPSRGWLDQNMLIYCTFVILMWGLSPCGVRVGGSKHAHILYVLVILMWGLSLCGVRGAGSKHAHILYVLVILMWGLSLCGMRGAGSKHAHILYVLVVLMCGMSP